MAKKLDISVAFLSLVDIVKRSGLVGMKEKIIEFYAFDEETTFFLRRESESSRTSFTIKPSNPLSRETAGMFLN
ncbi:hypothetical protein MCW_00533 [Cardidatus Bartonella washoeensis 085-0475]|uniref:Uncharacterized protein n=1 Tax=Cardidatus Bartonella washoeensis 085-0475 TaxID=1094564 RepID=J0QSH9_9HYPH|nr:hypothetical protein MCW_00533 [Bartonella washoeensis 085-0475]